VALSPDGRWLYATNTEGDSSGTGLLHIYDTEDDNIHYAAYNVGRNPVDVTVSSDGTRIYVANADDGTITVIDEGLVREPLDVGGTPTAIALSPDGNLLYIAVAGENAEDDGALRIIDLATGMRIGNIGTGRNPSDVAVSADGTQVFVTNTDDGTVTVYTNTATELRVDEINAGRAPTDVAVSPDGTKFYVTNSDGTVVVLAAV
jgi:YVTN family beta-propeller protein